MFRQLTALIDSPKVRLLAAGVFIAQGLQMLNELVREQRLRVAALDLEIKAGTARLVQLKQAVAEAESYPAGEDLDPLRRGEPAPSPA